MLERLLLIRHGQTEWNLNGRWQGATDVPLNDEGWHQARVLASYLKTHPVAAIYSSDLLRAWHTATTIGDALQIAPRPDPRWRELDFGIFQGLTRLEIETQYPGHLEAMRLDYYDYVVPNGETRRALQTRAFNALQDVVADNAGPEVIVVSHGGTLGALLLKLFGEDSTYVKARLPNTSITTLERLGSKWRALSAGQTPHLDGIAPSRSES